LDALAIKYGSTEGGSALVHPDVVKGQRCVRRRFERILRFAEAELHHLVASTKRFGRRIQAWFRMNDILDKSNK
jgi:DNA invertase Pin-like site-specific DNA recombinase